MYSCQLSSQTHLPHPTAQRSVAVDNQDQLSTCDSLSRQLRLERMQPLTNDLAELRAAIYREGPPAQEGLQKSQQRNSISQPRSSNSNLQQVRHATGLQLPAGTIPAAEAANNLDLSKVAEQLQERSGRLSSLHTRQQQIDAQLMSARPSLSRQGCEGGHASQASCLQLRWSCKHACRVQARFASCSTAKPARPHNTAAVPAGLGSICAFTYVRLSTLAPCRCGCFQLWPGFSTSTGNRWQPPSHQQHQGEWLQRYTGCGCCCTVASRNMLLPLRSGSEQAGGCLLRQMLIRPEASGKSHPTFLSADVLASTAN